MTTFLIVLHVLVSVFLIVVVLLQRGRGAEIGAVFGGGGSGTVFGSRGAGNFLTKLTTASAIVFMLTSLLLSYRLTPDASDRLFQGGANVEESEGAGEKPLFEEVPAPPAAPEGTASGLPALPETGAGDAAGGERAGAD